MPSSRRFTMPNLPSAPCSRTLNSPVFRGWMKIGGTSFPSNPDLQDVLASKPGLVSTKRSDSGKFSIPSKPSTHTTNTCGRDSSVDDLFVFTKALSFLADSKFSEWLGSSVRSGCLSKPGRRSVLVSASTHCALMTPQDFLSEKEQ